MNLEKDVFEIAAMFLGIAVLTLLIGRSGDTVKVLKGASDSFGGLLKIVTLQNGYQNPLSGGLSF